MKKVKQSNKEKLRRFDLQIGSWKNEIRVLQQRREELDRQIAILNAKINKTMEDSSLIVLQEAIEGFNKDRSKFSLP